MIRLCQNTPKNRYNTYYLCINNKSNHHFHLVLYIITARMYIITPKMYIITPKMYIFTPIMYIFTLRMYIFTPIMCISTAKMYIFTPSMQMDILPLRSVHKIMQKQFGPLSIVILNLRTKWMEAWGNALKAGIACFRGGAFYRIFEISQGRVSWSQIRNRTFYCFYFIISSLIIYCCFFFLFKNQ